MRTNISSSYSTFSLPSIRLFIQKRRRAHLAILEYANWWRTPNRTEKSYSRILTKRFQSQNEHANILCYVITPQNGFRSQDITIQDMMHFHQGNDRLQFLDIMHSSPGHYAFQPRTLCIPAQDIMHSSPGHYAFQPRTLCIAAQDIMHSSPGHYAFHNRTGSTAEYYLIPTPVQYVMDYSLQENM